MLTLRALKLSRSDATKVVEGQALRQTEKS